MTNINKEQLLELLRQYDEYIQYNAKNNTEFGSGWFPVCIKEFYENEFNEVCNE